MTNRYDRSIRFFGHEGQERLATASVVVVGVGGLGTHVVQQLALLGVGKLTMVDDEELEESNRNRYVTARSTDPIPGSFKAHLGDRLICETNGGVESVPLAVPLQSRAAFDSIVQADYVFGCLDDDVPRVILTELCAAYTKPYFDLASDILLEESAYGGRVCVAWDGQGCLICLKQVDLQAVQQGLAGEAARRDRETIYGLPTSELEEKGPSVVSINGVVASLAVTEFMLAVTGVRSEPKRHLIYRGNLGIVTVDKTPPVADCYYCTELWGKGVMAGVERHIHNPPP